MRTYFTLFAFAISINLLCQQKIDVDSLIDKNTLIINELKEYYSHRNTSLIKKDWKEDSLAYNILISNFYKIENLNTKVEMATLNEYIKVSRQFFIDYPECDSKELELHTSQGDYEWGFQHKCMDISIWNFGMKNMFLPKIYSFRAQIKFDKQDYRGALDDYQNAISIQDDNSKNSNTSASIYYNIGACFHNLQNKEGACKSMSKAGELGYNKAYEFIKQYCQ